jgi:transglutaminase-like putative cysteine protease
LLKSIIAKLPDIFLSILISFSITYALTSAMGFDYPPVSTLLIILAVTAVLLVAFHSRISSVVTAVLAGVAVVFSVVYVLAAGKSDEVLEFFKGYYYWLYDFIMYADVPDPAYGFISVAALCLLVCILSYIFVIRKFMFFVILAAGAGVFAVQATYRLFVTLVPFYLFLVAALMSYLKHVYIIKSSRIENEYAKPSVMLLWSLPVSIVLVLLASSFDASEYPIQWKWLDQKIARAYSYLRNRFDYETFDYFSLSASSGFGDRDNFLGGRVRLDRTNVLYVTSNRRIYLRGATRDVYTGNRWINSVDGLSPLDEDPGRLYSDTDEMIEGLKLLTGSDELPDGLLDGSSITVTFLNLKTKSLFVPPKIISFEPETADITAYISDTGDISSKNRLTKDFRYKMTAYVPATASELFRETLSKSRKGLYSGYLDEIDSILRSTRLTPPGTIRIPSDHLEIHGSELPDIPRSESTDITEVRTKTPGSILYGFDRNELLRMRSNIADLKEHSDAVHEKYLQLPEDLPQRIRDLAASLVVSADNDYDKARAIEKYLAENFAYNLDVRSTPRNRDFVDYFLFDLQEGYCSYFASAMTILARCAGLPARYVEGYMLPPSPVKERNDAYMVTNLQAHAWTEIYFEGFGWLPFEPTPPFRSTFYTADIQKNVNVSPNYDPSYNYYMEMMERYYRRDNSGYTSPGRIVEEPGPETGSVVIIVLLVIGASFLLLLAFNAVRSKFRLFVLASLPARTSILRHYNYYIGLLKLAGFGIQPAETPYQYSVRIDRLLYFSPVRFRDITDVFVRIRYSTYDATENEKKLFTEFNAGILNEIRASMGSLKYFVLKYILGRM